MVTELFNVLNKAHRSKRGPRGIGPLQSPYFKKCYTVKNKPIIISKVLEVETKCYNE